MVYRRRKEKNAMRCRLRVSLRTLVVLVGLSGAAEGIAQEEWHWPAKGKNYQVFPKDFPAAKLSAVMRGFTRALGVRCTYCHVGEEGQPLSAYDFVSDARPNKNRAREMYRMLGDINAHLQKIQPSGDKRINMWCQTCHEGRPRPATLEEELGETYRKSGVVAAIARYRELRERYFGKGGYNFGEDSLDSFGSELLESKDAEGALAIWRLNTTQFPNSSKAWESLAGGYAASGNRTVAEIYYRKALELDPGSDDALAGLRKLEEKPIH
jgi:tetratricopeptide (TPR) repeat protein